MAGVKVSALTAAGTLDGTEQVPVVQSGATVRTTISGISSQKTRATVTGSTYTVQPEDDIIEINTGTCAVTLPALSSQQKPIKIVKISSTAGTVTITRAGSDVISTASLSSIYLEGNGEFYELAPLSTRWDVTAKKATRTITGSTATLALEDALFIDAGTCTVTVPANLPNEFEIHKISATAGTITINAPSGSTYTSAALSSVTLTSNGDYWRFKKMSSTRIDLVAGIETGTTATGRWKSDYDGALTNKDVNSSTTTTATGSGSIYRSTSAVSFTFPKAFIDDNIIISPGSKANAASTIWIGTPLSLSSNSFTAYALGWSSATNGYPGYTATGRWY